MNSKQAEKLSADTSDRDPIVNVAAYRFVTLHGLPDWRGQFREITERLKLLGTVLLSHEGINMFVSGTVPHIEQFLTWVRSHEPFRGLEVKYSPGDHQPFNRMLVRLKKEIISMGVPGIDPAKNPGTRLAPRELKKWLDEGRELILLDTRNDYEVELGTFSGAVPIGISHFRQYPAAVKSLPDEMKHKPIVMFCTGGIRCEKAAPLMEREGFEQIYQLDGGILRYFEECGGDHYEGDCFVFDKRVAVNPSLVETDAAVCFACQAVLTAEQQKDVRYRPPESCPFCFRDADELLQERIEKRQRQIERYLQVLPGAIPYTNVRPLNVPGAHDGQTLLQVLMEMHGHLGEEYWRREIDLGMLRCEGQVLDADTIVRGGWRVERLLLHTVEPDVSRNIRIVHEDDSVVVVDKPAPLPVHPGGRFNRNTLVNILNQVYRPSFLRPAHRLDANTTGLVVMSRTRAAARIVQPQFEKGEVGKVYLAKVRGLPNWETHDCNAPIGRVAEVAGGRSIQAEGLPALTKFLVLRRYADGTSLIECRPLTGRTNQIRLHLSSLGLPIVGDPVYGDRGGDNQASGTISVDDSPMCLHAWRISFRHPVSGDVVEFESPRPAWVD